MVSHTGGDDGTSGGSRGGGGHRSGGRDLGISEGWSGVGADGDVVLIHGDLGIEVVMLLGLLERRGEVVVGLDRDCRSGGRVVEVMGIAGSDELLSMICWYRWHDVALIRGLDLLRRQWLL